MGFRGHITRYDSRREYGYIRPASGGEELLFRRLDLVNSASTPSEGSEVAFIRSHGPHGPKAVQVQLLPHESPPLLGGVQVMALFTCAAVCLGAAILLLAGILTGSSEYFEALREVLTHHLALAALMSGVAGGIGGLIIARALRARRGALGATVLGTVLAQMTLLSVAYALGIRGLV